MLPDPFDFEEEDKERSRNMSQILLFLLRSASVVFTLAGWVEVLLWETTFDPDIVLYVLESGEDFNWTDVLLEILKRTINLSYFTQMFTMWLMMFSEVGRKAMYPNFEMKIMLRLLSECCDLRGVEGDKTACWAAQWLSGGDFKTLITKSFPDWFQIEDLLINAALAGSAELVIFLVETRGDEIRENEECVFRLVYGPAAKDHAGKEKDNKEKCDGNERHNQEAAEHRWKPYCQRGIWTLLFAGSGSKIPASDETLEGAKRSVLFP